MDFCDFSGDNDFSCFVTADDLYCCAPPNTPSSCHTKTSKENVFQPCRRVRPETTISECYPPCYPPLPRSDPFGFLRSASTKRNRGQSKRRSTVVLEPLECCNHDEPHGSRRFFLQFNPADVETAAVLTDKCYLAERARCLEFWEWIDETPDLLNLIKEGKFFHRVPPACDEARRISQDKAKQKAKPRQKPPPKYTPEMEALRQRNIALHQEEKKRREKNRKLQNNLHEKYWTKKPPEDIYEALADKANPAPLQVLQEMEIFDEICQNPVRVNCDRRLTSIPCREPMQPPIHMSRGGGDGDILLVPTTSENPETPMETTVQDSVDSFVSSQSDTD